LTADIIISIIPLLRLIKMAEDTTERISNLIKTLKLLDWGEEDIAKVLKIKKEDVKNLVKNFDL
jgi:hypothetical protein